MKVEGFNGTYEQWLRSRPRKEIDEKLARAAPTETPRVNFKLDDIQLDPNELRSPGSRALKDVGAGFLPEFDRNKGPDGSSPVPRVPRLAGDHPSVPRLRGRSS
jgi:hypothetical protein